MTQEEPVRLVVHISDTMHKAAKATAALRGITLRELVEVAIRRELAEGLPWGAEPPTPSKAALLPVTDDPATPYTKAGAEEGNKALEEAVAAHLEREIARGEAEHERRIRAGIIKG